MTDDIQQPDNQENSSNNNEISFEESHLPPIKAGELKLSSSITFSIKGVSEVKLEFPNLNILVSGPRFIFSPAEIYSVFPPRDSLGEFDNVLPHIELHPSTLPWQRADDKTPWLALILLQEDEWTDTSKVKIEKMKWVKYRDTLNLKEEITDQPSENDKPFPPVKVLNIEESFCREIIPTKSGLRWLTHVRVGHDLDGNDTERAIVVCNRLPRPGSRAEVHLISLEGRLNTTDSNFKYDIGKTSDGKIPVLSLHSWQFTCPNEDQFKVSPEAISRLEGNLKTKVETNFQPGEERERLYRGKADFKKTLKEKNFSNPEQTILLSICRIQTETFKGLMDKLDLGWLRVPTNKTETSNAAEKFFEVGSVPMSHGMRSGGKTISWYHGPLIADKRLSTALEKKLLATLPLRNADQLLTYNKSSHMLDASYAAAWELGRLISINKPRISQQIAQWKTSHARELALTEQNLFFDHIPFTDSDFVHKKGGQLEKNLQQYFSDLRLLKGVPFHYLIPHESLLPDESLRIFYIDPLWIECLLDGAFSIGRTTQFDQARENGKPFDEAAAPTMMGVLLRSDLVSSWPSLLVEGYSSQTDDKDNKLNILRFDRLGPNVLLIIFKGDLKTTTVHLPPESLHFGFSRPNDDDHDYFKELVYLDTPRIKIPDGSFNLNWKENSKNLRVFDADRFLVEINSRNLQFINPKKISDEINSNVKKISHSGQFALEMLGRVPKLQVTVKVI